MREAALIAAAAAVALPFAAKAWDADVYYADGSLRGSLRRDERAPVYSTDPRDPWNRLFHLGAKRESESFRALMKFFQKP
jgi:hypothetical protein